VSLIARHLEANGIPTVIVGCAKDIVEQAGVPRFLWSDFPLGNSCGRPGDVEAVGPLHGTHEPPFYVCGSDQWVAGYMEGAVRTGRAAAAAALHQEAP